MRIGGEWTAKKMRKLHSTTLAGVCNTHGFWMGTRCSQCVKEHKGTMRIITHDWIKKGVWEHIDPHQPHMKFDSKKELLAACSKRGLIPKAFLKPCSQARGWEAR